jgi:hypothetical protein
VRALRQQLRWLMPREAATVMGESGYELWLREKLSTDPGYSWRGWLRENYAHEGRWYVDANDEQVLIEGWSVHQPLGELCAELAASDLDIANHLVAIGIAGDIAEVADRLGVIPGGTLDVRLRMAADRANASVWVLVVNDPTNILKTAQPIQALNLRQHISIHATYDDAVGEFDRLLTKHQIDGGNELEAVEWSIADRTAGEHAFGTAHYGLYPQSHPGGVIR